MGRTLLHAIAYRWFQTSKWAAAGIAALLSASRNVVPESWPSLAETTVLWVRGFAGWPLFLCVVYSAVAFGVSARLEPPRTWRAVHGFLDDLRDYFFKGTEGPLHEHRVTLLRWKKWTWNVWVWSIRKKRWPWSGWLVPVARSGHTTQRSWTRFLAPQNHPASAEGFAGQVWASNRTLVINGLPNLHDSPSEDDIDRYARGSFASVGWIKQRLQQKKPCARSFCGMPVEVNNELWGVIVIDSQIEELPDSSELREIYGLLGRLLGNMLQGS